MMRTCRTLVTTIVLSAVILLAGGTAYGQDCEPGFPAAFQGHATEYNSLFNAMINGAGPLFTDLAALVDQPTYATLLADAHTLAASIPTGRVVVTVPDGTVVLDTGKPDDPGNTLPAGNSFQHYQNKTVNENHNSRVAILSAQMFPCGYAIERKLSTTTHTVDTYLALRVGTHLDSLGTLRLSITSAATSAPAVPTTPLPRITGQ